eukprot:gnl/MRDRNA2_/MRDRNA2_313557_c0_seq1.p1 gnl/MRDRNA2_/MRDRNA2_313557_c0~~gnl/MRDRNA2_/MRDRNA2_313557_c0_seq1.p1  ORF type:complete len:387 (+),score=50.94 gnl/MRDRNA2_/MRDRNA2_313557_c0_seq1:42-1163(+)
MDEAAGLRIGGSAAALLASADRQVVPRIVRAVDVSVAFLLGCDEHTPHLTMLVQVDLLRTLRRSIEAKTKTLRLREFLVVSTHAIPAEIEELLVECGFGVRKFPELTEGLGPDESDKHLFKDLHRKYQVKQLPAGWWWGWLKFRLWELTEVPWILYLDSDMVAVGDLDPLFMASVSPWANEADFGVTSEPDDIRINNGLMLIRTGLDVARSLQSRVASCLEDKVGDQNCMQRILGAGRGNAVLEDAVLTVSATWNFTQSSVGVRWCYLPRQFNVMFPRTVDLYGQPIKPWEVVPGQTYADRNPVAMNLWLPAVPPVLLHFTGKHHMGKPWEKAPHQRSLWDDVWWLVHASMCAAAAERGEPPCAIQCSSEMSG